MRLIRFSSSIGVAAALALVLGALAGPSRADVTLHGSGTVNGTLLDATAIFSISGGTMTVTLENSASSDVLVPPDVLTGLFFNVNGSPALSTPSSALIAPGSSIVYGPDTPPANPDDIGGEWAYKQGISYTVNSQTFTFGYGLSTAGLGVFGSGDVINGNDRNSSAAPDGLDYGLLSAGDNTATGNTGVTKQALIKNAVVFTFTGVTFTEDDIDQSDNGFHFQYGTALTEPGGGRNIIPEPAFYQLASLIGLGGFGLLRLRRSKKA